MPDETASERLAQSQMEILSSGDSIRELPKMEFISRRGCPKGPREFETAANGTIHASEAGNPLMSTPKIQGVVSDRERIALATPTSMHDRLSAEFCCRAA